MRMVNSRAGRLRTLSSLWNHQPREANSSAAKTWASSAGME